MSDQPGNIIDLPCPAQKIYRTACCWPIWMHYGVTIQRFYCIVSGGHVQSLARTHYRRPDMRGILLFSGVAHRLGSLMALPASMALPKISQHPPNQLNLLPIFSTAGRFRRPQSGRLTLMRLSGHTAITCCLMCLMTPPMAIFWRSG